MSRCRRRVSAVFTASRPATLASRRTVALRLRVVPASPSAFPAPPRAVVDAALRAVNWPKVKNRSSRSRARARSRKRRRKISSRGHSRRAFDRKKTAWNPLALPDGDVPHGPRAAKRQRALERAVPPRVLQAERAEEIRVTQEAERVATMAPTPRPPSPTTSCAPAASPPCARGPRPIRSSSRSSTRWRPTSKLRRSKVESLGIPLEDVRRGRRRMFDHADAVARELPSDGNVTIDDDAEVER